MPVIQALTPFKAALRIISKGKVGYNMPLKIINYNASAYKAQLKPRNKNKRYPVVSLVLYLGYTERWQKGKARISMRTFLDDAFDEGKAEGKITARYEDGMTIEQIAERTNVSVDLVISVLKKAELIKD